LEYHAKDKFLFVVLIIMPKRKAGLLGNLVGGLDEGLFAFDRVVGIRSPESGVWSQEFVSGIQIFKA